MKLKISFGNNQPDHWDITQVVLITDSKVHYTAFSQFVITTEQYGKHVWIRHANCWWYSKAYTATGLEETNEKTFQQ